MRILIRKIFGRSIHSTDLEEDLTASLKMLYFGAAGVIWALRLFSRVGVDGGQT